MKKSTEKIHRCKKNASSQKGRNALWEQSRTYTKTFVDVMNESVLILDKDYKVVTANEAFCNTFKVSLSQTEGKSLFSLGRGHWKNLTLQKLLRDLLNNNAHFKGFEISRKFQGIGSRVMILNARKVHVLKDDEANILSPLILLSIDDITDILAVARTLAINTHKIQAKHVDQVEKLKLTITKLKNDILKLKKKGE